MSSLLLGDLNDYLEPSQACIKPPINSNAINNNNSKDEEKDLENKIKNTVSISLDDCLACSGCITSAESILITQQTHHQLLNQIDLNLQEQENHNLKKTIVISISPQSRAAIAKRYSITLLETMKRITGFFKNILGQGRAIAQVFDVTFARHFSLMELKREMQSRLETRENLPMISSSCPGWICYAEKKYPDFLNLISRTKSPQQVMGSLVKYELFKNEKGEKEKKADQIYHVTIMPCFDKKLEASRRDFYNEALETRDVDSVITTTELLSLIESKCKFLEIKPEELDYELSAISPDGDRVLGHRGGSSGGYLEYLLNSARIGDLLPLPSLSDANRIQIRQIVKNPNYKEYFVVDEESENIIFSAVAIYGFKNIQSFVIKKRANKLSSKYDFIEIMACPQGCINGGGQPKPIIPTREEKEEKEKEDTSLIDRQATRQYLRDLELLYQDIDDECDENRDSNLRYYLETVEQNRQSLLQTSYRPVLPDSKSVNVSKW